MSQNDNGNDFINEVSNFKFNLHYHDKLEHGGKLIDTIVNDDQAWITFHNLHKDMSSDYWDFEVEINGYYVYEEYEDYLNSLFEEFKNEHDIKVLKRYTRGDCYDLLMNEKNKLIGIKMNFGDLTIIEDPNELPGSLIDYNCYEVIPSDPNKYFEDDFNVHKKIAPFLRKKSSLLHAAISLIEMKLEWFKIASDESFGTERIVLNNSLLKSNLIWTKSDTDLLELITALMEIKAINNIDHNLTRKDAIEIFSKIFGREIKDAESKLSRATERKKDISPFLNSLKESFDNYAIKKEQK